MTVTPPIQNLVLTGARFSNRYSKLGHEFFSKVFPTKVAKPQLIALNSQLAQELGLDAEQLATGEAIEVFAGNRLAEGSLPLAQVYAGHQFGHYNPQLGDGRAILLGELLNQKDVPFDIQLKGAGPTPYSRNGDGRAALGPVVREYILCEARHARGIKTTRALAAVTTGEFVYRQTPLPGAVLTRVASSHVRVGTFEYFRACGATESLKTLANFVIDRHYPAAKASPTPYLSLLEAVINAQIELVSSWMSIGFIHGVMNTDNTAISGETLDYGPCAFMDTYDPATVFSSIDHQGRYAFGNQPSIAHWNVTRFAECLFPLMDGTEPKRIAQLEAVLATFNPRFNQLWLNKMGRKMGLANTTEQNGELVQALLRFMKTHKADFTSTFYSLNQVQSSGDYEPFIALFHNGAHDIAAWLKDWKECVHSSGQTDAETAQVLQQANPIVIPRNHLVEEAIHAAHHDDFSVMTKLIEVLRTPYIHLPHAERYYSTPPPNSGGYQTFCGT